MEVVQGPADAAEGVGGVYVIRLAPGPGAGRQTAPARRDPQKRRFAKRSHLGTGQSLVQFDERVVIEHTLVVNRKLPLVFIIIKVLSPRLRGAEGDG
mgnify:CR=1 FL=1